jgi:ABC-type transport system involved in cytochrome bd biosynthesis fused ATPase/permease subunit
LVGANGSGKSTCLRLLLGLGRPRTGAVRLGGVDLRDTDLDAWRERVAFLPQRPYLPQRAEVRAAVRLLAPEASDARIVAALDRVGVLPALHLVSADPLAARIDMLSVGQRQRVALARLLCRDAALLVLDEPDANLDREGIALDAELIRERARHRMIVFAAHTPELVALAGRTLTLGAGRVDRDETHEAQAAAVAP